MTLLNFNALIAFIKQQDLAHSSENSFPHHLTQHLRLNAIYWSLAAAHLLAHPLLFNPPLIIQYTFQCSRHAISPFAPHIHHDPHLHSTLSALQIFLLSNHSLPLPTHPLSKNILKFILSLFDPHSGSFAGDEWGEIDIKFSYCAIASLALLNQLHLLDTSKAALYIVSCQNFDGGFGSVRGAESHAAYVWTAVAALAILNKLHLINKDTLVWWLSERQLQNGGLNGRPEKLEDVCYSWWALASLSILGKKHWIDGHKLSDFIISCQDPESGGISDRPGDVPDIWHTLFGIAGLSLLNYPGIQKVDPIFCLPSHLTEGLVVYDQVFKDDLESNSKSLSEHGNLKRDHVET